VAEKKAKANKYAGEAGRAITLRNHRRALQREINKGNNRIAKWKRRSERGNLAPEHLAIKVAKQEAHIERLQAQLNPSD
jgi:SMC interacting uncharacterized protein involved in chromosome segregation